MKWYGILALLVLIGILVGVVLLGMNIMKVMDFIIFDDDALGLEQVLSHNIFSN